MKHLLNTVHFIHTKKLYLIPIGIFILFFLLSFYKCKRTIYPDINVNNITAFNDQATGGNSRVDFCNIGSSAISVGYTLGEKLPYPYAGIKFVLTKDSRHKNLSAYDLFSIDVESKTQQDLNIYFHTIIPGYTDEKNALSYRYFLKNFKCQQRKQQFTVPVKSFTTPTWWYVLNKFPEDSLPKETFKEVAEIVIENGYIYQSKQPYTFTLHKLVLHKDMVKRALFTLYLCIGWFLFYGFLYFLNRNHTKGQDKKVVVSYKPLVVDNNSDQCLNRILTYIANEYKDPGLTVNRIASEVGLLPVKITQILREKKNCSYKQYLNAIRLTEAKRLLLETDRNIVDIAVKVGYSSITHFNRIFKEMEGVSPRQFRISALKK
jgi:AraC-like DNA-binding protein